LRDVVFPVLKFRDEKQTFVKVERALLSETNHRDRKKGRRANGPSIGSRMLERLVHCLLFFCFFYKTITAAVLLDNNGDNVLHCCSCMEPEGCSEPCTMHMCAGAFVLNKNKKKREVDQEGKKKESQ